MRTRSRSTTTDSYDQPTYYYYERSGRTVLVYNSSKVSRTVSIETMTDDPSASRATKFCEHKRSVCTADGRMSWRYLSGTKPNRVFQSVTLFDVPYHASGMVITTSVSGATAYRDMIMGAFNDSVLAPVFFKELPEVKSTFTELRSAGFGRKSFANKFLAFKFGVLPFIGDLVKMYELSGKITEHINTVNNSKRDKPFKQSTPCGSVSGSASVNVPTSSTSSTAVSVAWKGSQKGYLKGIYSRRYDRGDEINMYLDAFGANLLACGWEAIPYSFVVDWFFSIGDYINYLTPKNQVPCVTVLDSGVCTRASISLPLVWWDDRSDVPVNYGARNTTYFMRSPNAPVPSSILGNGLTLSRASTATALILQKL